MKNGVAKKLEDCIAAKESKQLHVPIFSVKIQQKSCTIKNLTTSQKSYFSKLFNLQKDIAASPPG